jgi:signal transduction histidine kinase
VPREGNLDLYNLDLDSAQLAAGVWPPAWSGMRERLQARLQGLGPGPGPDQEVSLIDLPRFGTRGDGTGPNPGRAEQEWLLVELNVDYVRSVVLPELLQRYLGGEGRLDYQSEVVSNNDSAQIIYRSNPDAPRIGTTADASVGLLEINYQRLMRRALPGRRGGFEPPGGGETGTGRWRLLVRHQAGSLEALVTRARRRNYAISAGILVLMMVAIAALVRFSRQAQILAELQMNFVAGVSHELRTPLTVIRTAAFNLRGKLAGRPDQVERYGKLIQEESEKLAGMVEQVLQFASTKAGRVIRKRTAVSLPALFDGGICQSVALAGKGVQIEKILPDDLPPILADGVALRHALQNLVDNAVKYGTEGSNWIGIFARAVDGQNGPEVEIRVADRGPGIPADEQAHIFDPFFRGRRAVQDQVHGTGLGLNLVKKIVEAHGGTIRVSSQPMKGTEFIVRIPAAPPELQDEFANSID